MPAPGTFVLHSRAVPDLSAGRYQVHVEQRISARDDGRDETLDAFVEVTAPRFVLPPDQVLSTFPPNQAQGEFSARLPQIVLRRRTLPWERTVDGNTDPESPLRQVPWLALVVLADAECEFLSARPAAECVTAGLTLGGRSDSAVGNAIRVTDRVVREVFPTKEELPLLAHVRDVDLRDTELALGDDDGWLAVLIANRLPQPGIRYRACLVSLEGQYDLLSDLAMVAPDFAGSIIDPFVYPAAAAAVDTLTGRYVARTDRAVAPVLGTRVARTSTAQTIENAWSQTDAHSVQQATAAQRLAPSQASAALLGAMHAVDMHVIDPLAPLFTFPVLAHWQFTCTGAGDFRSIMQGLDVGMLGTLPQPPPPPEPGRKPPAPPSRPPPTVLDTGHVALAHVSRGGENQTVWYRGPLVPRPAGREMPDANGVLPLLHASDQARRIGPDGRENLSLAAAFEIGRLLALSQPSVVAALLNWRKEGFETARRAALIARDLSLAQLGASDRLAGYAARLQHLVIVDLGRNDADRLGGIIPPIDPGRPIDGFDTLDSAGLVELFAAGFGLPPDMVAGLIDPGATRPGTVDVPVAGIDTTLDALSQNPDVALGHLRAIATDVAQAIAGEAAAGGPGAPDALDRLLGGTP